MSVLNYEQIKAAAAAVPQYLVVPVPQWHGDVRLKKLSAPDGIAYGRWESAHASDDDELDPAEKHARKSAKLLSLSLVDEAGAKLFDSPEGYEFLRGLDFDLLNTIGLPALQLNGMLQTQAETREKN